MSILAYLHVIDLKQTSLSGGALSTDRVIPEGAYGRHWTGGRWLSLVRYRLSGDTEAKISTTINPLCNALRSKSKWSETSKMFPYDRTPKSPLWILVLRNLIAKQGNIHTNLTSFKYVLDLMEAPKNQLHGQNDWWYCFHGHEGRS